MKVLQTLINGSAPLSKQAHIDTATYFIDKGYKEIIPYHKMDEPREMLKSFYQKDHVFTLTPETLKQLRTVYKVDGKFEVQFAASFFVVELDQYLVTYLDVIKTDERCQRQGFGAKFIADLAEFLKQHLIETP